MFVCVPLAPPTSLALGDDAGGVGLVKVPLVAHAGGQVRPLLLVHQEPDDPGEGQQDDQEHHQGHRRAPRPCGGGG